jgi:hypothetical protein
VQIVNRPGFWIPNADLQKKLLSDLRSVAGRTRKDGELNYGILPGDPDRTQKSIVTVLYDRQSGAPGAFNAPILPNAGTGSMALNG